MNALVTAIDVPANKDSGKYKIHYSRYAEGSKKGIKEDAEFDFIIGSDGANSRVAKVKLGILLPNSQLSHGAIVWILTCTRSQNSKKRELCADWPPRYASSAFAIKIDRPWTLESTTSPSHSKSASRSRTRRWSSMRSVQVKSSAIHLLATDRKLLLCECLGTLPSPVKFSLRRLVPAWGKPIQSCQSRVSALTPDLNWTFSFKGMPTSFSGAPGRLCVRALFGTRFAIYCSLVFQTF